MSERKTVIRYFTIADFEEEEIWLRQQHNRGWRLLRIVPPVVFIFESCEPEDVVYRLDYKNNTETGSYFQMFSDYGWEYVSRCMGWLYFRKPASEALTEQDNEIFSDGSSKVEMISRVMRTRLLPILTVFLCCVLPNYILAAQNRHGFTVGLAVFYSVATPLLLYLIIYCGVKLRRLRKKYGDE